MLLASNGFVEPEDTDDESLFFFFQNMLAKLANKRRKAAASPSAKSEHEKVNFVKQYPCA